MNPHLPEIIFEDASLLVLDKPAGWVVNTVSSAKGPTIETWLKGKGDYAHRLDKETSGVLVTAKTESALENLRKQFKERRVEKTYTALLHGKLEPKEGSVAVSVGRLPWRRDRFGILPGGRPSRTDYKVNKYYTKDNEDFSLVSFFPSTGRTHQIRIHAKYLGHPIVADEFYAGRKTARKDRIWCPRLFLHASRISFVHPETKKTVSFFSDLPKDLKSVFFTTSKEMT